MTKTYADTCIERAEKATEGPWFDSRYTKAIRVTFESPAFSRGNFNIAKYPTRTNESLLSHEEWEGNAEFIAHSRQDVPELARRLKKACEAIRLIQDSIENAAVDTIWIDGCGLNMTACDYAESIADELEAMPGEK